MYLLTLLTRIGTNTNGIGSGYPAFYARPPCARARFIIGITTFKTLSPNKLVNYNAWDQLFLSLQRLLVSSDVRVDPATTDVFQVNFGPSRGTTDRGRRKRRVLRRKVIIENTLHSS
jgi:hypothetical protein